MKKRIAFLVSGGGTNMQAVIDAIEDGTVNAQPVLVVSSSDKAYALERAAKHGIDAVVLKKSDFASGEERDRELLKTLDGYKVDLVVLAGYLGILSPFITDAYQRKIINIHPALLPKFGGKGFHGLNVHRAVLAAGERVSGATVHYVDAGTDTGEIIRQAEVPVIAGDTPESLAKRILDTAEHPLLVSVVRDLCAD